MRKEEHGRWRSEKEEKDSTVVGEKLIGIQKEIR